jgi:hypothetical protein
MFVPPQTGAGPRGEKKRRRWLGRSPRRFDLPRRCFYDSVRAIMGMHMNNDATTDITGADGLEPVVAPVTGVTDEGALAAWFAASDGQLSAIASLNNGWDSHGAGRPRPEIVASGRTVLIHLARILHDGRPHINPTRSGGVQLEWESGPRYLEIEVTGIEAAEYCFEDRALGRQEQGAFDPRGPVPRGVVDFIRHVMAPAR